MPKRSADGLTYTFRIRRGYRFSPPSGEPVTAENFKYAIERSFNPRMRGPMSNFDIPIAGVREYATGRARQISGVTAEGDRLIIRLTRRYDDLPTRLAMPFFCAIPMGTPIDPHGVRAIPSAGPYYIASEDPGEGLVLRRNPNYEGPRPRRSAEIRISVPVAPREAVARVEDGRADFATEAVTPRLARRLASRHSRPALPDRSSARHRLSPLQHRPAGLLVASAAPGRQSRHRPSRPGRGRRDREWPAGAADGSVSAARDAGLRGRGDLSVRARSPKGAQARGISAARGTPLHTRGRFHGAARRDRQVQPRGDRNGRRRDDHQQPSRSSSGPDEPWDVALISWYADRPDPIDFLQFFDSRRFEPGVFNLGPLHRSGLQPPARCRERTDRGRALTSRLGGWTLTSSAQGAPVAAFSNEAQHSFFSERVGCQIHNPVIGINLAALCIREQD